MRKPKSNIINLVGMIFGNLTVVELVRILDSDGFVKKTLWKCQCDCGNETLARSWRLRDGITKSCGCTWYENFYESICTHGKSHTREYNSWEAMIQRCHNPNSSTYKRYGAMGIHVCDRWRKFENFLLDIGNSPGKGYSIERLDNKKGYEPGNCIWADSKTQARNKSNNRNITHEGQTLCLEEWSKKTGIHRRTLKHRLDKGLTGEALFRPARKRRL